VLGTSSLAQDHALSASVITSGVPVLSLGYVDAAFPREHYYDDDMKNTSVFDTVSYRWGPNVAGVGSGETNNAYPITDAPNSVVFLD